MERAPKKTTVVPEEFVPKNAESEQKAPGSVDGLGVPLSAQGEARYKSLFDCAPDPVFLVSTRPSEAGRIVDANDLAASVHGYTREELLKLTVHDLDTDPYAAVATEPDGERGDCS